MKHAHTVWHIRIIFFILAAALALAWSANLAHADEAGSQLSIAQSGQVIIREAKVIALSGDVITVATAWGATSMTWSVHTSGSTRFIPDAESSKAIKAIKIGHVVAITGELDVTGRGIIRASVVRDAALVKESAVVSGRVLSVGDGSFTIKDDSGTTTITVGTRTIITRDGNTADISELTSDDVVKVFGTLNTVTSTLSAERVTWKRDIGVMEKQSDGIFASILSWFKSSRGALSVRDR